MLKLMRMGFPSSTQPTKNPTFALLTWVSAIFSCNFYACFFTGEKKAERSGAFLRLSEIALLESMRSMGIVAKIRYFEANCVVL